MDGKRAEEVLGKYFGHREFREGQRELISAVLAGRDVLGVMPTGGGKSLCYQIPALLLPGTALVISPLISLMKDQVAALTRAGIPAAFLNSSLTPEEQRLTARGVREGAYRLLYAAPERLGSLSALFREEAPSLVAVDEAHCISQWGQDFRPSYLEIAAFTAGLPRRPPVAAFTATATPRVREDIVRLLGLREPFSLVTGFDRPNLFFDVLSPPGKFPLLLRLIRERRGKSGIVYCATRNTVDRVWEKLRREGVSAAPYHAGLTEEERRRSQDSFQYDRAEVMVATNAFGMGIDKSNVSFVIHYNMPKSLEAYYQEAGRAGRDGSPADCILLFSPGDIRTARLLMEHSGENPRLSPEEQEEVRRLDRQRLSAMVGYCKTAGCLRGYLLDYFGQPHGESCGSCGRCRGPLREEDATREAQIALSCAVRIRRQLGHYAGASLLEKTLRGSRNRQVLGPGLDGLSTYGLLREKRRGEVRELLEALVQQGYLREDPRFQTLEPTRKAAAVLFEGERVMVRPQEAAPKKRRGREAPPPPDREERLFQRLREERARIAQEEKVPPYIVFSNASLREMASKLPTTPAEFMEISGVGAHKAARYAPAFLRAIVRFLLEEEDLK